MQGFLVSLAKILDILGFVAKNSKDFFGFLSAMLKKDLGKKSQKSTNFLGEKTNTPSTGEALISGLKVDLASRPKPKLTQSLIDSDRIRPSKVFNLEILINDFERNLKSLQIAGTETFFKLRYWNTTMGYFLKLKSYIFGSINVLFSPIFHPKFRIEVLLRKTADPNPTRPKQFS